MAFIALTEYALTIQQYFFIIIYTELQCDPPPYIISNSTQMVTSLVPTPDGIFGIGSMVRFECTLNECLNNIFLNVIYTELQCDPPPYIISNSTQMVTSLVPTPDGIYGVGSMVSFKCITGYALKDGNYTTNVTCTHRKTWTDTNHTFCEGRIFYIF